MIPIGNRRGVGSRERTVRLPFVYKPPTVGFGWPCCSGRCALVGIGCGFLSSCPFDPGLEGLLLCTGYDHVKDFELDWMSLAMMLEGLRLMEPPFPRRCNHVDGPHDRLDRWLVTLFTRCRPLTIFPRSRVASVHQRRQVKTQAEQRGADSELWISPIELGGKRVRLSGRVR